MAVSIGPVIGIKGEKEFRAALKEIIAETKKYSAEMDRLTASFDKNDSALSKNAKQHELLKTQIEKQTKVVDQNMKLRDEAQRKLQKDETVLEKQKELLANLNTQYEHTKKKVDALKQAYGESHPYVQGANSVLRDQEKVIKEETQRLEDMQVSVHRSGEVLQTWETKVIESTAELERLNRELKNTNSLKAWGEQLQDVGGKMEEFGESLSKYVSAPLAALGTASVKAAADFEDGMAKIYTIAVDSREPMEKMRQEIVNLSNETGFSLEDLTEATYQAVSASVDATKAVDFMVDATKLARAGFTTTTKSVDLLTTVINAYNYEAKDATWISDMLLKTQNDGKTILDELASSMGIIIPMASNYNVKLDQIAAAYATMTKQGVKTERATTFLRAVFTELEKEGSDVADILEDKTGKSFAQLMGEGKSLSDVLRILYKEAGNNTEEFQRLFGNVRSTQAVASLVNDDFKLFDYELKRVRDSAGQTDKALEQMETPALKAKRAVNQLKNSSVELGESMIKKFTPQFEKGVDTVRKLTDSFNSLSDGSKDIIIDTGLMLTAIPPLITLGGKLVSYVGALLAGTGSLIPLIGGLAVAMVGAYTAAKVQAEEERALMEAQWGVSESAAQNITDLENLKLKHEELQTTIHDEWTASLDNAAAADQLALKYDSLIDSTGNVKAGMETLAETLLGQIADALGMNIEDVEVLIDEHGLLHGAIQQTIEDYKQQALAAAYQKELEEATYRQVEAERINAEVSAELTEQANKLTEANQKVKDAQQAITEATKDGTPATKEMVQELYKSREEAKVAQQAYRELTDAQSEAAAEAIHASDDMDYWADKIANVGKESEDTAGKVKTAAKDSETAVKNSVDNSVSAIRKGNTGDAAYYFVKGFADGIDRYSYLATSAAGNMGANASRALKNKLQVKSPSRVTAEVGKYFVEGFENSIADGMKDVSYLAEQLGSSATKGLSMGSYLPEAYGNTYNKTVTAPISINLTVNGNVDDPNTFARNIADMLADELTKESEVFA